MCVKCPKWWLLCLFMTFYGQPVNHGKQSRIDDGCGESRVLPTHSQEQVECASVSQCFNYQNVHHSHNELSNGCILYNHNQAGLSVDSWFLAAVYSWLTVTSPPAPPRTGTAVPSSQLFNFFRFLYWSSFIINCCGYRHCILFSISNDSSHRNILNVK